MSGCSEHVTRNTRGCSVIDLLWGLGGMLALLSLAVLLSVDRKKIRLRTVGLALAAQVLIAVLVLYVPWGATVLNGASTAVQAVIDTSADGIDFLFGPVLPEEGSVFAFQVLPVIVFFASLTAVLYHLNVLQWVVRIIGGALAKILGTTRPESMNAAANIFVGQTEAPLVIRPYVKRMTRSELFAVMVGGMSTVAGSVLVGYSLLGARLDYLIAASFMAAPGALAMAKLLVPAGTMQTTVGAPAAEGAVPEETAEASALGGHRYQRRTAATTDSTDASTGEAASPSSARVAETDVATGGRTEGEGPAEDEGPADEGPADEGPADEGTTGEARNVVDAAAHGAADGLNLALNIGAMLLAFISLIALGNLLLGWISGWFGADLTIEQVFGYVFAPVMFLVGTPWPEALQAGSFLGQKVVLNEFVACSDFAPRAGEGSAKTQAVA